MHSQAMQRFAQRCHRTCSAAPAAAAAFAAPVRCATRRVAAPAGAAVGIATAASSSSSSSSFHRHSSSSSGGSRSGSTICRAAPPAAAAEPAPGLLPLPWTGAPEQLAALEALRARMQAEYSATSGSSSSSDGGGSGGSPVVVDDALLQWYLRDRYFNVDDAEAKLRSMLAWRRAERIDEFDATSPAAVAELATGKAYVHSAPDRFGRPVVVIRVRKHVVNEFPLADSKRLCGHVLDQAVAALPPGGEQIAGVFDLRGFGLQNADLAFAAFLVEAFFEYYPRRMGQVLMVDAPWVFKPTWEVIKPLLRKYSALVKFVDRAALKDYFDEGSLPDDFKA